MFQIIGPNTSTFTSNLSDSYHRKQTNLGWSSTMSLNGVYFINDLIIKDAQLPEVFKYV